MFLELSSPTVAKNELKCSAIYDYDYDYEMVLLRHTISTIYHGIIFKSCKKTQYITMKCVIGEQTRKVCCPLT